MLQKFKPVLFTVALYIFCFLAVYLTEKLYVPRGANDITGPPFLVMVLGLLVILVFFLRSIYLAIARSKDYWYAVMVHMLFLLFILYRFFM